MSSRDASFWRSTRPATAVSTDGGSPRCRSPSICSGRASGSTFLEADREQPVEIVFGVHLERDQCLGLLDARHLRDALWDDAGEILISRDANDRDEVHVAGDGVHLRHALDVGDRLSRLGDRVALAVDENDGVEHRYARSRTTAMPWPPETQSAASPSG